MPTVPCLVRCPTEKPKERTSGSTKCNGFQDICSSSNTPIYKELEFFTGELEAPLFSQLLNNLHQNFYSGAREVQLSTTVIGQDHSGYPSIICLESILHRFSYEWCDECGSSSTDLPTLDTLQNQRYCVSR